ncbi:MAG: purple acid phosphatase family protein [Pseudomonadales bacterium]
MLRLFKTLFSVSLLTLVSCAELTGVGAPIVENATAPDRLFLQQLSDQSAIIKWRGTADYACVAKKNAVLTRSSCKRSVLTEGNHQEVLIDGLSPDTQYSYSVGGFTADTLRFRTAPEAGNVAADGSVRMLILGDSGSASSRIKGKFPYAGMSTAVLNGYQKFLKNSGGKQADALLMLGDNAYQEGTDEEWQLAVFDIYPELLSQMPLWSTIGNHEMGAAIIDVSLLSEETAKKLGKSDGELVLGGVSTSSDPNSFVTRADRTPRRMPYLDILTLPANAELGGVPSGTEQYYSFNHGNVHVVSLDSQLSMRDELQRKAMHSWLEADLSANEMDWTIVIFHHPVYTKGSHDSDTEASSRFGIDQPILDLRTEFTPLFEQYSVDITFSGHSHSYERSWYLHGHRGDSHTFNATEHAELNAKGDPAIGHGDEAYHQQSWGSDKDDKVVYTVAGSSGHVKMGRGKLNHPAHAIQENDAEKRHGLEEMGSVIVDATKDELTARFINETGKVLDTVVIKSKREKQ